MFASNPGGNKKGMDAQIQALLDRGEEHECLELSEVNDLVDGLALEDEEVEALFEEIERRHIELRDDCGRESAKASTYANGDLAAATTARGSSSPRTRPGGSDRRCSAAPRTSPATSASLCTSSSASRRALARSAS